MYPQSHFLFPFLLAKLLNLSNELALAAGLIGMLVDIDHFIYHAIKHKTLSLKKAWNAAVVVHEKGERTFIHHKKGFFLLTILFGLIYFFNPTISLVLALGYYSHILLDYGHLNIFKWKKSFKIIKDGFTINLSLFELIFDLVIVGLLIFVI